MSSANPPAAVASSKNVELVLAFFKAGEDRDVDNQMTFFAPDAVYHNMPEDPIFGAAGIRALLESYAKPSEEVDLVIKRMAESPDGTVLTERVDRFKIGGKWIECIVMGSCDIKDGKIVAWRDYYDNAKVMAQLS